MNGSSTITRPITTNTAVTPGWPELRRLNAVAYPHSQSLSLSHIPGGNIATAYFRPQLPPELEFDTDRSRFTRRARLEAENLLLRLVVLRRKSLNRLRLWNIDRLLLVWLYRLYPSLLDAIIIVQPGTALRWHRPGFRAYWRWKSRYVGVRPRINSGI